MTMTKLSKAIVAAAAGAALLTAAAGSALAHGTAESGGTIPHMQPAHMGQGHGGYTAAPNYGYGPRHDMKAHMGPGMMMGSGTMGSGTMDHGPMMGHGMMSHGMTGHGMMGMMQQMHQEMMGHGMQGGGHGHGSAYGKSAIQPDQDLSVDDVRTRLERSLKWHGNERLKVGEVKELDDDTIVAEIVTLDDSLVDRLEVDRHSGSMQRTE
jgi:hypothetical protein